ncbi:MAG TPA: response regulator [Polyangiaceae bacterium]|jgi:two-component system chemotaxis response regulator CheY|nr:response regulator [Polyangiaceae bacterium]
MPKKVIVIDDSATVRQQVAVALIQAGFEVIEAADGDEGVEVIGRTADAAMVICDVNMPRMNGLELLEAVKKDGKNASLPVLMLTTEGQPQLIERAKKSGAKGWVVKPFKPELLVAAVKKLTTLA